MTTLAIPLINEQNFSIIMHDAEDRLQPQGCTGFYPINP